MIKTDLFVKIDKILCSGAILPIKNSPQPNRLGADTTSADFYPNQLFCLLKTEAHNIVHPVLIGRAVKASADEWVVLGFHEARALIPIDLAKLATLGINSNAILEQALRGRVNDFSIAILGQESLPILGMIGDARLAPFWPTTSAFPDLPGAVTGAVMNDEPGRVRDEGVGTGNVTFLPVSKNPLRVWPGVGIRTYLKEFRLKLGATTPAKDIAVVISTENVNRAHPLVNTPTELAKGPAVVPSVNRVLGEEICQMGHDGHENFQRTSPLSDRVGVSEYYLRIIAHYIQKVNSIIALIMGRRMN